MSTSGPGPHSAPLLGLQRFHSSYFILREEVLDLRNVKSCSLAPVAFPREAVSFLQARAHYSLGIQGVCLPSDHQH